MVRALSRQDRGSGFDSPPGWYFWYMFFLKFQFKYSTFFKLSSYMEVKSRKLIFCFSGIKHHLKHPKTHQKHKKINFEIFCLTWFFLGWADLVCNAKNRVSYFIHFLSKSLSEMTKIVKILSDKIFISSWG